MEWLPELAEALMIVAGTVAAIYLLGKAYDLLMDWWCDREYGPRLTPADMIAQERWFTIRTGYPSLCNFNDPKLNPSHEQVEEWLALRNLMLPRDDDPPEIREHKALWWRLQREMHGGPDEIEKGLPPPPAPLLGNPGISLTGR